MVKSVVGIFFTCVVCGTVEEIHVPREEGLPPNIFRELNGKRVLLVDPEQPRAGVC
jgi:hypothetical protein